MTSTVMCQPPKEFAATLHQMYCAEQIVVPQRFPNILKDYAKAVIRTQPYDLLRWSAAYFRCMATNVPPPAKLRLEPIRRFGTITKGYLKVLLEQVGKGFFVNREVLQNRWESLSLPEDELLSFLSLCRMLDWQQIHWLKLFGVLVGTLNESLIETMTMLCELLTEDVEGSPCPIPMWMSREVYTFLAELDCSDEQKFIGGRKVIGVDNELEPITHVPDLPKIMNLEEFRCAIVERFLNRIGIDDYCDPKDFPYRLDQIDHSSPPGSSSSVSDKSLSSRPSHVSSSFKFIADFNDPTEVIRRTPDFDGVLLLLQESQGFKLHEYQGSHQISDKTLRHVSRRETERMNRIQHIHDMAYSDSKAITQEEHDNLMKKIEPPWSWIHHFSLANCRDKSYNFLEVQTIASDETPSESSDESFDFENNQFLEAPKREISSTMHDNLEEVSIENLLLKTDRESVYSTRDIVNADELIDDVIAIVQNAVDMKEVDLQNNMSILSFLDEEMQSKKSELDLRLIREAICYAEEMKIVFRDLGDFHKFLQERLPVFDEKSVINSSSTETGDISSAGEKFEEIDKDRLDPQNEKAIIPLGEKLASPIAAIVKLARKPIESQFEECLIEVDDKTSQITVPDKMIIGLVSTPPPTPIIIPTPPRTPTPEPPSPHNTSSAIITCNVSLDEFPREIPPLVLPPPRAPPAPKPFECHVPAIPGIGAPVSRETIRNFVTYLKGRSCVEKGMVFPRHFRESKCPNLIDTYEG